MALSDYQQTQRILRNVGASINGVDVLSGAIDAIWAAHADKTAWDPVYGPELQRLYATREAIEVLQAVARQQVDWSAPGASVKWSQQYGYLDGMWKRTQDELSRYEEYLMSSAGIVAGPLTATTPVDTSGSIPDPNDPRYAGRAVVGPSDWWPGGW